MAVAVGRGHDVVAATRGMNGTPPARARHVVVDRDSGLESFAGARFDAVVDVARMSPRWVRDALTTVSSPHWTFVSSMSVYDDDRVRSGQTATDAVLVAAVEEPEPEFPSDYAGGKVACERLVLDTVGDGAFVVRPSLVVGVGDPSDRYGYWPARLARGGRVLVPGPLDDPAQLIDVDDLAAWVILAAEHRLGGVFDAACPPMTMAEMLRRSATGVGAPHHELVTADPDLLLSSGIRHYMGPSSLPLWAPMRRERVLAHDVTPSLRAGLRIRPLEETAASALAHERALGLDRTRRAGLTPTEESAVLTRLG